MGPLILPLTGLVYIDASGLIYSVERVEPYRPPLEPMWQGAQDGNLTIVSSPVLLIEAVVKPLLDGNVFGDNFQEIRNLTALQLILCAALNLTVSQSMFNIGGRANVGVGLMNIQTFEIVNLQIVNPQLRCRSRTSRHSTRRIGTC